MAAFAGACLAALSVGAGIYLLSASPVSPVMAVETVSNEEKTLSGWSEDADGRLYLDEEGDPLYDVEFINDKVYTKSLDSLEKYLRKNMKEIYKERVDFYYKQFVENVPYPVIKFRTMKTRWGVCNRSNNSITLNTELIKYDIGCLNYVIVHELSHFVHFDHSKEFWATVEKYYPEYKKYRSMLKN